VWYSLVRVGKKVNPVVCKELEMINIDVKIGNKSVISMEITNVGRVKGDICIYSYVILKSEKRESYSACVAHDANEGVEKLMYVCLRHYLKSLNGEPIKVLDLLCEGRDD